VSLPYATAEDDLDVVDAEAEAGLPELPQWRQPLWRTLRETWDSRHLLRPMAAYAVPDFSHTFLGRWWLFFRPGLPIIGYAILIGGIFRFKAPNSVPYLVFLLFGLQGWHLFQSAIVFGTRSFQRLGKFARNLNIPLVLVPTAALSRALVVFGVYAIFGVFTLAYFVIAKHTLYLQLSPKLLVGVAGWVLSLTCGWAVGLFTAALYTHAKDIRYMLPLLLQFLMFCTPVVYGLDQVPGRYRTLAEVNPMASVMELVKYGFLNAGHVHLIALAWSLVSILGIALAALWFFNRVARASVRRNEFEEEEEEGL
jgi:lipopolysaccharide transport system permease protein